MVCPLSEAPAKQKKIIVKIVFIHMVVRRGAFTFPLSLL